MTKVWQIFLIVTIIGGAIFWWMKHERQSAKNEVIIEQQQEEIEQKENVIQVKNFQQKLISKPALSADLAARDEWLQLLWKKADSIN